MFLALLPAGKRKESAMKQSALRLLVLAAVVAIVLPACILPNCTIFLQEGDSEMVNVAAEQIVLLWDASPLAVDHYTVYFRIHGTPDWVELGDVPADPNPEYTVQHSTLGDGEFDFAVVAVDASAQESAYHTSLDTTASPETGWYVSWYVE